VDSKVGKPYDNLAEALHAACLKVQQGEVILLSPGFASFDRYENMAERGEHFKQLVQSLELF
jgi:UDP-N-acetylmuramoylalanine--D-glutamate ligase